VTACPHALDALVVEGACSACIKVRACNGHRDKLSLEQRQYVGFDLASPPERGWRPAWTILPAFDGTEDDSGPEQRRGIVYVMQRGRERQELSV